MANDEQFERWLAERRETDLPRNFADRVMSRLDDETAAARSREERETGWTWLHVVACSAASVVFVLRLASVYSLFFVF